MSIRILGPIAVALAGVVCVVGCPNNGGGGPPDAGVSPAAGSNSGAFAIVTVAGVQKLYLPVPQPNAAGHGWIAVVDIDTAGNGTTGAPAQITTIDLGTSDYATTVGGNSTIVVAASTKFPDVWLIDPTTDTVKATVLLDPNYGQSGFSGGGGYITGVAIDAANGRAVLSVWNGFQFLDLATAAFTDVLPAPPVENFGFDSARDLIYAPFYDCTTSLSGGKPPSFCGSYPTDGLNVVNLSTGTVFTYLDGTAPNPQMAVGAEPDSAAVNASTQIVVVPAETSVFENVIDFSKAVFDAANHSVTAPHYYVPQLGFTGVSIDPSGTFAFFSEEYSANVALSSLALPDGGTIAYAPGSLPAAPGGAPWANVGDPHGIGTTILTSGTPVGVLVNSTWTWLARIDLSKMSAMPADGGISPSNLAAAVTFLDPRTKK